MKSRTAVSFLFLTIPFLFRLLKNSRSIKPYECNWLLFASIVEAALLEFDGKCDVERLMYGVEKSGGRLDLKKGLGQC